MGNQFLLFKRRELCHGSPLELIQGERDVEGGREGGNVSLHHFMPSAFVCVQVFLIEKIVKDRGWSLYLSSGVGTVSLLFRGGPPVSLGKTLVDI